jgi:tRNA1(Val) A37 N6-methylase TrmN6
MSQGRILVIAPKLDNFASEIVRRLAALGFSVKAFASVENQNESVSQSNTLIDSLVEVENAEAIIADLSTGSTAVGFMVGHASSRKKTLFGYNLSERALEPIIAYLATNGLLTMIDVGKEDVVDQVIKVVQKKFP